MTATDCPGVLSSAFEAGDPADGYLIEVCPRQQWLGQRATHIEFCDYGPDVIVLHRADRPSAEEYRQAAVAADRDSR